MSSLEDQLHKLILLPGPTIRSNVLKKVQNLAHQVNRVNEEFPATKHLVRTAIFNIFTDKARNLKEENATENGEEVGAGDGDDGVPGPVTPFIPFVHRSSHPLEAVTAIRWDETDHLDLVRADSSNWWVETVSGMLNNSGLCKYI